jgi:transposase
MGRRRNQTNMGKNVYTEEFKRQIVALHDAGKPTATIMKEYHLNRSTFYKWVNESKTTGSFKAKDNRTPEENELIQLRKDNQQLRMENDILKQAALIMGRK